jgi:hypothetical protein
VLTGFFWLRRGSAVCLRYFIETLYSGDSDNDDYDYYDDNSKTHHGNEI